MKKKILILLILMVFLTGCGVFKNSNKSSASKGKGTMYYRISLNDTVNGVGVFETILPEGWRYAIESRWDVVSSSVPGLETVMLSSPDARASILIRSQEGYVENKKYNEGINKDYYTTYLHYMDASSYLEYYVNSHYQGASYLKDMEIDDNILNQLKELNNIKLEIGKRDAQTINSVTPDAQVSISDHGVSSAKKQYQYGSNVIEISSSVSSLQTNLVSKLSPLLNSEAIDWLIPYTIVFQAEDEEAFQQYYDTYNFIIANSHFTTNYYAMVEYVSSYIVNLVTSIYAERAKAALEATNQYIDSHYSSTSSQSTNDKIMEMWDDVIKEEDKYQLEDGSYLKTSIFNDVVAQNGDEIYIGDKAGVPIGFDILDKKY